MKAFVKLIKGCSRLFTAILFYGDIFSIEHPLELQKKDLQVILRHSVAFHEFLIPRATLRCSTPEVDFLFTTGLCNAKSLYWLDLTCCSVSTLGFLQCIPNIKILNLSECANLVDADVEVISTLHTLDHLYLSFTNITPNAIVRICAYLRLSVLDTSGIPFKLWHCAQVLKPDLAFVYLSLERSGDEAWLYGMCKLYNNLAVHIHRII